jgi:P pilus assembly chaperone PapD
MFILLFFSLFSAHGGVSVGGTRLIFDGNKKEASITVNNSDKHAWLIQSWIDHTDNSNSAAPFLVTPPLFRLDSGQSNLLRVIPVGHPLPEDKESLFWMNVKSIPSGDKPDIRRNTLQLAIKTRIKFIWRPATLKGVPENVADKLIWKAENGQITVLNPTPFYMNFGRMTAGGQPLTPSSVLLSWVAPGATLALPRPAGMHGNEVTWTIINDFGGTGKTFHAPL